MNGGIPMVVRTLVENVLDGRGRRESEVETVAEKKLGLSWN